MNVPKFISSSDNGIKRLLRKQGTMICRDYIYPEIIETSIEKFDYGFVLMIEKARVGQTMLRLENRLQIYGFVLTEALDEFEVRIHLICVDDNHKGEGAILMQSVLQYAKENDYVRITLHALPDPKLVEWYQSFGFVITDEIYKSGQLKVYAMTKVVE